MFLKNNKFYFRYSPSSSTISSSVKATPAFTIQPQENKTVNISSYETGTYQEEQLWSLLDSEAYSTSPMSLENMSLSEEVASLADLLPGSPDQMILPDQIPTGTGKILLTGSKHPTLPKGKKLITKDKVVVAPTVAEVTYPMDIDSNIDLLDSAFEEVKIEQPAQNEMMMLAEYDVPVIHIAEPQNNTTNQIWSANSIFDEENSGLSSSPSHYMMTINPYEAEGLVSVSGGISSAIIPEQAPEEQQQSDNANADDLLKFVMDETIGADIETFNTHFNITEDQVSTINVDDLFNPQPSTSTVNNITIKTEVTEEFDGDEDYVPVPAKRPRGRPRLPRSEDTLPRYVNFTKFSYSGNQAELNSDNKDNIVPVRRPRGRPATAPEYANVSEIDSEIEIMSGPQKKEAKYRRMRDLNNAASKRCRVNRKRKFEEMETEVQREEARNAKLKIQMEALETQVDNFKKMIIDMIKTKKHNQQITVQQQQASIEEFDIDTLVKNTLEHM